MGVGRSLGLAVSRSVARDHGGELTLQDDGSGACFCLQRPVRGEPEASGTGPAPLVETDARNARLPVVDDATEMAEPIGEPWGDAIISDLHMPKLDGAGLWREVKRRQPALARHMLFFTGDTLSPTARQFLNEAHRDSLNRPFSEQELRARVSALLAPCGVAGDHNRPHKNADGDKPMKRRMLPPALTMPWRAQVFSRLQPATAGSGSDAP